MRGKQRLSASVDADLIAAAEAAVKRAEAPNLSAWVTAAFRLKLENDRRLQSLAEAVAVYEAEHGEITEPDIEAAVREARRRAIPVRGMRASESRSRR